jgi:hypothetical protein
MKPDLLILMIYCSPLDFIQLVEVKEKDIVPPDIEELTPAGNGGGIPKKKAGIDHKDENRA